MEHRFSGLRRLLNEPAGREQWEALWCLFLTWPDDKEKTLALDYAQQHLRSWTTAERQLTSDQLKRLAELVGLYKPDQSLCQFWNHASFVPLWPLLRSLHTRYSLWHTRKQEDLQTWGGVVHLERLVMEGESFGNERFAAFVRAGTFGRLRSLKLAFNQVEGSAWCVEESPEPWRLEELSLRDNPFQPGELTSLLLSPNLPALRSLSLEGDALRFDQTQLQDMETALADRAPLETCKLRALRDWPGAGVPLLLRGLARGVKELSIQEQSLGGWFLEQHKDWLSALSLRSLDLSRNALTVDDIQLLGERFDTLEELRLDSCELGDEHLVSLALGPSFPSLRTLSLEKNVFGDWGVQTLLQSPLAETLQSLTLDLQECSAGTLKALCRSPLLRAMRHLRVGAEVLSPETTALLSQSLETAGLESLDLSYNPLTSLLTELMVQGRGFAALRSLRLSHCQLEPGLLLEWTQAPWWRQVRAFDLSHNRLTGLELDRLLEASPQLEECSLDHCGLTEGTLTRLERLTSPSRLRSLSLSDNSLGEADGETLLEHTTLPALETIKLHRNEFSPDLRKKLVEALDYPRYNLFVDSPSGSYLR